MLKTMKLRGYSTRKQPKMPQMRILFLQLMAGLLTAAAANAHDFWIDPDTYTPAEGEQVVIELREGEFLKGDTLPYIDGWFADFTVVDGDGRNPVSSMTGNDPAATLSATRGQTLLGYKSIRAFVELDAAKFNAYLEDEGIEFLREERRALGEDNAPAPEYFVRCAKALLQSTTEGARIYDTWLGYTLEITPLSDPYQTGQGDDLEFEVRFRNKPVEGLLVQAFTQENPQAIQKVRTDKQGRATITLTETGTWMVKATNIQRIIGDPKARWQSWWANYLFRAP